MNKTLLAILAAFVLIAPLQADTLLSGSDNSNGGFMSAYTVGYTFQVGPNSLSVYALGNSGDISYNPCAIGLWDYSGTLLAQTTVPYNLTPQSFIWNTLSSPITLQSGQSYTLGSVGTYYNSQNPHVGIATDLSPYVSIIGGGTWDARYGGTAYQLNDPVGALPYNKTGEGYVVLGPNMQFTAIPNATPAPTPDVIPEPSTYALFGIGAIGLLMVIRRKKVV